MFIDKHYEWLLTIYILLILGASMTCAKYNLNDGWFFLPAESSKYESLTVADYYGITYFALCTSSSAI